MRVIIAEDDPFFQDLLAKGLSGVGVEVVGRTRTTSELLRLVDADPPDLVLLDLKMPRENPADKPDGLAGLDAAKEIRDRHPKLALLALSEYEEVAWLRALGALGERVGYLVKRRAAEDLEQLAVKMQAVIDGEAVLDRRLFQALTNDPNPLTRLTEQEKKVLGAMAGGRSNREIAEYLHIAEDTVQGHLNRIYRKLDLADLPMSAANRRVKAAQIWHLWHRPDE